MVLAMAKDLRVVMIKLADILHIMRTIDKDSKEEQRKMGSQTLEIFAPLANRLGLQGIKIELEELGMRYLYPSDYKNLYVHIDQSRKEREIYIQETIRSLYKKMAEHNIKCEVNGRPKHIYSIYRKMIKQNIDFSQIYDITAFRVIVDTIPDCYNALGFIHSTWKPIERRFKDYIAVPKQNMYQSLHTGVIGPRGRVIEIQIRTHEMHEIAEYGVAAHWLYKERNQVERKDENKFSWLRRMQDLQHNSKDPKEFVDLFKLDLFEDEVYVFSPKGDLLRFRGGSTPLDFAYSIHSGLGDKCTGARINGKFVPLRYKLRNGDIVDIIKSKNQRPTKDWLNIVKTSKAKAKIRAYLRAEERESRETQGREKLEKALKKQKLNFGKLLKEGFFQKIAENYGLKTVNQLLVKIGYDHIKPATILLKVEESDDEPVPAPEEIALEFEQYIEAAKVLRKQTVSQVRVSGEGDTHIRFAKCCNPLPGDQIVGFITRGRGITVHNRRCKESIRADPGRAIDTVWDTAYKVVRLNIISKNKIGILADVSRTIANLKANILNADIKYTSLNESNQIFDLAVNDSEHTQKIIRSLRKIEGVNLVKKL